MVDWEGARATEGLWDTPITGMRRITTFRSTTDRIYDSGPIRSCVLFYLMCFVLLCVYCCLTYLVAGLLARSQYPEGPATGHLGTCFSWFLCVYKRMLRWFPRLQVATGCFSCSPPDLNFLDPYFIFVIFISY